MDYYIARAAQRVLQSELDQAAQALSAIRTRLSAGLPVSPVGLTPDVVKRSEEYRTASFRYADASKRLRTFNGPFLREHGKRYATDLRAERRNKNAAAV